MAQYDVFKSDDPSLPHSLLLNIQSDLIRDVMSRVVVPLVPEGKAPQIAQRLNPVIDVAGKRYVALFQDLQSIPTEALGARVGNVSQHRFSITTAVDFLLSGV
jgi:toxin CcdB